MDDLAATLRPIPAELARNSEGIERLTQELQSIRGDMSAMRSDLRADLAAQRADLSALQRQIAQIGWALSAALVGVLIGLIVAVV